MAKLYTYRMTHDVGFAPNPFHKVLTLATCKYCMRKAGTRKVDQWIAGFASYTLQRLSKKYVGKEVVSDRDALIWLGKLTESPILFEDYFHDSRFQIKKPFMNDEISQCGDNIYKIAGGNLKQDNGDLTGKYILHPHKSQEETDIAGEKVLIFEEFYYLGDKNFVPKNIGINVKIPKGQAPCGNIADAGDADKLIAYMKKEYGAGGQIGEPCMLGFGEAGCDNCGVDSSCGVCKSCGGC